MPVEDGDQIVLAQNIESIYSASLSRPPRYQDNDSLKTQCSNKTVSS
jgi:hypothetical protein